MKHQALFSLKDKIKKIYMSSAAILHNCLRVKWFLPCKNIIATLCLQYINIWQLHKISFGP